MAEAARRCYALRFPLYVEFIEGRLAEGGPKAASSFFDLRFHAFRPERLKILAEPEFGEEVHVVATVAAR